MHPYNVEGLCVYMYVKQQSLLMFHKVYWWYFVVAEAEGKEAEAMVYIHEWIINFSKDLIVIRN